MKSLFCYLLLMLLFSGCQQRGDMNLYITNKSTKTLLLKTIEGISDTVIIKIFPNDHHIYLYKLTDVTPRPKRIEKCICNYPYIQLLPSDTSFKILKDINNPENWTKKLVKGKFGKSADYTDCLFEISQEDIQ